MHRYSVLLFALEKTLEESIVERRRDFVSEATRAVQEGIGRRSLAFGIYRPRPPIARDANDKVEPEDLAESDMEVRALGVVMVKLLGTKVFVNPETEWMFDYGPDGLCGQTVDILFPARRPHGQHAERRRGFADHPHARAATNREAAGVRKDGGEHPAEIGPSRLSDGALVGVAVEINDSARLERSEGEFVATVRRELPRPRRSPAAKCEMSAD